MLIAYDLKIEDVVINPTGDTKEEPWGRSTIKTTIKTILVGQEPPECSFLGMQNHSVISTTIVKGRHHR